MFPQDLQMCLEKQLSQIMFPNALLGLRKRKKVPIKLCSFVANFVF